LLDRGSLVNFNIGIAPALETHCQFEKTHGWVQDNDWPKKIDGAAWQALFLQVALATTLLAEGMARTAAGAIDGGNVRSLLVASSIKYKFPFGRALNAIGTINPSVPLFGELRLRLRLLLPTALVVLLLRVLLVVQVVLVVLVELAILGVPLVQLDVSEEDVRCSQCST